MEIFERIEHNALRIADTFSESLEACLFLTCFFAITTVCCIVFLTGSLFEMHRGRSANKKVRKKYNTWQRVVLRPAWYECLHAKRFCRFLIICYHIRVMLLLITLIFAIMKNTIPGISSLAIPLSVFAFFALDTPILVLHLIMEKYPFRRRKHEYRFQKYHNTKDYDSLF